MGNTAARGVRSGSLGWAVLLSRFAFAEFEERRVESYFSFRLAIIKVRSHTGYDEAASFPVVLFVIDAVLV